MTEEGLLIDAFHKWLACSILLQAVRDLKKAETAWAAVWFLRSPDAPLWKKIAGCENGPAQVTLDFGPSPVV